MPLNKRARKETLAAITAAFYENQKRQQAFYERFGPELGGIVCAHCGHYPTAKEIREAEESGTMVNAVLLTIEN